MATGSKTKMAKEGEKEKEKYYFLPRSLLLMIT
jgi:hypothetical protein